MIRQAISPRLATSTLLNIKRSRIPTGVGLNPLHGLLIWGQLLIRASTSRSARHTTCKPGCGDPVDDAHGAVGLDGDVHEPVDVADQVPLAESPARTLEEKVLDAGVLVLGVMSVAQGVGLLAAGSADGVVAAAGVARRP